MRFFVQLAELVAVFVPDFLTLALTAPAFFSLCCFARTLGLAETVDWNSALKISLALGYLVTVTVNIVGSLLTPAQSRMTTSSWSNSRVEPTGRLSLPGTPKTQRVEHEGAFIES